MVLNLFMKGLFDMCGPIFVPIGDPTRAESFISGGCTECTMGCGYLTAAAAR